MFLVLGVAPDHVGAAGDADAESRPLLTRTSDADSGTPGDD